MVTKAKEVPWNEVEDLMEDLRQWLVTNAATPEREAQPSSSNEPRRLEPLEIAMETLRFAQIITGIQLAATAAESELARERTNRALPELQAELRPELRDTPVTAGPDWPQHIEEKAHELARLLEETKSAAQELSHHFSAFFEPGRPRFPMTVAGWQALRGDVSRRLERLGWLATKHGLQRIQSKST